MARNSLVSVKVTGSTRKTEKFLKENSNSTKFLAILNEYGELGVQRLAMATPKDTGETAASWVYSIANTKSGYELRWNNAKESGGVPIVILIQYGHATKNGGYVAPKNFINPVIDEVYESLQKRLYEEMRK